jgi:hypothetical protein
MSKLLRLPLVLLIALAMAMTWAVPATAHPLPDPAADVCLTEPLPAGCTRADAGGGHTGEEARTGGAAGTTGTDGTGTVRHEARLPAGQTDDPTVTQPTIQRFGDPAAAGAHAAGSTESADGPAAAEESEDPDPAVIGRCIADEIDELIAGLQTAVGAAADDLVAELEAGLAGDPATVAAGLPAFLEGLPALVEGSAPELATELEELLPDTIEGIVACLPEPPAGGPPPATEPPARQPVQQQAPSPAVHYENCDDARAKGKAPVYSTDPGYRAGLDSDSDGIGCEETVAAPVATQNTGRLAYTGMDLELWLRAVAILVSSGTLLVLAGVRRRA